MSTPDQLPPCPHAVLRVLFLASPRLTSDDMAAACRMTKGDASDLVEGLAGFTALDALLVSRWLGTTPEFWLDMQQRRDLALARAEKQPSIDQVSPDPRAVQIAAVLDPNLAEAADR